MLLTTACTLTFIATSYGNSRVSQCNRLVAVVNEAAAAQPDQVGMTIAEDNSIQLATATKLAMYADNLESMHFSNKQLRELQNRFVKLYRDASKARGEIVAAPIDNFQTVQQVNRTFIETQERETPLVQAVNRYCRGE